MADTSNESNEFEISPHQGFASRCLRSSGFEWMVQTLEPKN